MRVVVCDADRMPRSIVEDIVVRHGHELVGIAEDTLAATELVERARPDVVILVPSIGVNSDFDVIESATAVHAKAIVFSGHADAEMLSRYAVKPMVVFKPDFVELEHTVERLGVDNGPGAVEVERRRRPRRAGQGPRRRVSATPKPSTRR